MSKRIEVTELRSRVKAKPKKPFLWPSPGKKTYTCAWCGDRCDSLDFTGLFDKPTGKPVCPGCEGTL